jgi:glycosyltransferase involved in cell wall biosynthesis
VCNSPMNIVYIASVRVPNEKASGLAIMRQCEAFAALNENVTLLRPHRTNHISEAPFPYYGMKPSFEIKTMNSIDFIQSLGLFGFAIARLSQMIASFVYVIQNSKSIDVVYARDPWMLLLPVFFLKKVCIWEAHQLQKNFCIEYVARKAHKIVCISKGLQEYYKTLAGRNDILVEPSGVDLEQFKTAPSQEVARTMFHVPLSKKVIGYMGKYLTMGEEKGVDELVHAFVRVHESNDDAHLLIVGLEPNEITLLTTKCIGLGLPSDTFTLLPLEQKNFASYVQMADILVMNYPDTEHYRNYMSPTKLFAYMAAGRVIVTTDLPSIREIVDDNSAIFVKPGDINALASGLMRAITGGQDLEEMITEAKIKVEKFTWNNRASRLLISIAKNG